MNTKLKILAFTILFALIQTEGWRVVRWINYDFSVKSITPFVFNDAPISVHWFVKFLNEDLLVMLLLVVIVRLAQMVSNRFYCFAMVCAVYKFLDCVLFFLCFKLVPNFYLALIGLVIISAALILYPKKETIAPVKYLQ